MTRPASDPWRLATVADTSAPGCDFVRKWLREHNWFANPGFMEQRLQPEHQARPLVLLAIADSLVLGGLFAETELAWLRISIMAVCPERRSQGIGAALLAEAESQAISRGCKHVYVDTMEYQAPGFYLAHGFAVAGAIADWDSHGHKKFFFTKRLDNPIGAAHTSTMSFRAATLDDCPLLAQLNQQLIEDEGHRNRMTAPELEQRMRSWLAGEYRAVIYEDGGHVVGYALFREQPEEIYLRQLFVVRHRRRQGLGRRAVEILRSRVWPKAERLTVDVLTGNESAAAFWRSVGYTDYSLTLEMAPDRST